jgi:hypothetical protein
MDKSVNTFVLVIVLALVLGIPLIGGLVAIQLLF